MVHCIAFSTNFQAIEIGSFTISLLFYNLLGLTMATNFKVPVTKRKLLVNYQYLKIVITIFGTDNK